MRFAEFHVNSPDEPGPDIGRLRRIALPQLPQDLWRALIADLAGMAPSCEATPGFIYLDMP